MLVLVLLLELVLALGLIHLSSQPLPTHLPSTAPLNVSNYVATSLRRLPAKTHPLLLLLLLLLQLLLQLLLRLHGVRGYTRNLPRCLSPLSNHV